LQNDTHIASVVFSCRLQMFLYRDYSKLYKAHDKKIMMFDIFVCIKYAGDCV